MEPWKCPSCGAMNSIGMCVECGYDKVFVDSEAILKPDEERETQAEEALQDMWDHLHNE